MTPGLWVGEPRQRKVLTAEAARRANVRPVACNRTSVPMSSRTFALALGACLAACATSQPSHNTLAPAREPAAPAAEAPPAALTPADQERELVTAIRSVTSMRWDVHRRLDSARARGDREELRCLDGLLTEMDAALRMVGEQRERFLFAADASAHRDQTFHRAMAIRSRATEIRDEARRCLIGGDVIEGTVTTVVVRETE